MKTKTIILTRNLLLAVVAGWCVNQSLQAAEPTALELAKEGNRYIGEHVKDKVVQIRSEKSIGGLTPAIWYIVYYDSTAALKAVEVKFGAGKMMDVKRPFRLLEPIMGDDSTLDRKKLKIDSDKAIKIATMEPLLGKVTLKASQLWLQRGEGAPVWKIRLWAAKLKKPNDSVDIGDVYVSAEHGKVVKADLHINRID